MRKLAFTLVELLIVVIILGILAAVVIPQFSDASDDARVSSLQTNLATIRGQIELYKMQHGQYPQLIGPPTFADSMTKKSDPNGALNVNGKYGPYMQAIPNNPFSSPPSAAVVGTATTTATSAWYYNQTTGEFKADDSAAHALY